MERDEERDVLAKFTEDKFWQLMCHRKIKKTLTYMKNIVFTVHQKFILQYNSLQAIKVLTNIIMCRYSSVITFMVRSN